MVTTSLSLDIPAEVRALFGKLPFKPASPGPALARTMKVPVMASSRQGETAPIGDDSIAKVVAALPFAGSTVGAIVPFPRLKLQEYASLRAELEVWPEQVGEILPRRGRRPPSTWSSSPSTWSSTPLVLHTYARARPG